MFELLFLGFAALAGKAVHFEMKDGEQAGQQPSYRPASGYPPIQYAQSNPQPTQYGQPHAYRAQVQPGDAYAHLNHGDGAYYAEVMLPSSASGIFATTMRYDGGASHVMLSHADAWAMGLDLRRQRFDIECGALASNEMAAPILIPMMGLGSIRLHDIEAFITQRDCGVSLLGQSALRKLSSTEQRGDQIVFRR